MLNDQTGKTESNKDDSFGMESGLNSASRFGIKGSEDLGNGMTVAFTLENGFSSDSGELNQEDRLFGREASLTLAGNFGQVSFGRMGGVASSAGTYDIVYRVADAFDGFDNEVGGLMISDRYDNMIAYQSPEFGGVKMTVQYSFKENSVSGSGDEGKTTANRYGALAAEGNWGALSLVAAWEWQNWGTTTLKVNGTNPAPETVDDQHTFYLGGNYDFGVTKVFAMAQYFDGAQYLNGWSNQDYHKDAKVTTDGFKGYGLHLGAVTPAFGGEWTVGVYYTDAEGEGWLGKTAANVQDVADADYKYLGFSTRYAYNLSKRTAVYVGAGYAQEKMEANDQPVEIESKVIQAYAGLKHSF